MIRQVPLVEYFPQGCTMVVPPGVCIAMEPLESEFMGDICYVQFLIAKLKSHNVELTAWYRQIWGGTLERVKPIYDGSDWHADMNN